MRRFTFGLSAALLLLASLAPLAARAQYAPRPRRETTATRRARLQREINETYSHRLEYSGGGGYLRFRSGQYLRRNNEITFYSSLNYFLSASHPRLGVMGEVEGAFGSAKIGNNPFNLAQNPKISQYIFTGGPSFRLIAQRRIALSVFGTGGVALGNFAGGDKAIPPDLLGLWSTTLRPAFTAGVTLDYNFYPNLAARITPTYIGTTFDGAPVNGVQTVHGTLQNNVGFNIGIVYRFH